jgi:hypothetical protein
MSIEGRNQPSQELFPSAISQKLIEKLGTPDIPFSFRTANDSVYVSDRNLRTLRYQAGSNAFQNPSTITVYMDPKYLDPEMTDRGGEEYLPNSLFNENGRLLLDDPELIRSNKAIITAFGDIPADMDVDTVRTSLRVIVYDSVQKKMVRKTPVSLMPATGFHPVEFFDPKSHPMGHRNHLGSAIENLAITNRMDEKETREAVEALAAISVENRKKPAPESPDDLVHYID